MEFIDEKLHKLTKCLHWVSWARKHCSCILYNILDRWPFIASLRNCSWDNSDILRIKPFHSLTTLIVPILVFFYWTKPSSKSCISHPFSTVLNNAKWVYFICRWQPFTHSKAEVMPQLDPPFFYILGTLPTPSATSIHTLIIIFEFPNITIIL